MPRMKRLFALSRKKRGFTLAEVIVATAIISFVMLATWRVITSSLHSITRQDQKIRALHISQAHLARLEAETFSKVVPENWIIGAGGNEYQLSIYDSPYPSFALSQFIESDFTYWYSAAPDGLGFSSDGRDDGTLVVSADGSTVYACISATTNETAGPGTVGVSDYNWDTDDFKLFFDSEDGGKEIQIYYRYYHLVDEGATIPSFDAEPREEGVVKLVTDPGDPNNIAVEEIESGDSIAPDDYDSVTRELIFTSDLGKSVWIYYLPDSDTDSSGPGGAPDGYLDPTENSIVGVVAGNFCNPDGGATNQITKTKEITLTEYWRQAGQIQQAEQKAYLVSR